jgi:hypothetical protein
MISRFGLFTILCCVVTFSGCVGPARVNSVPWWKGLPCMLIAPSSIESHVWRQHFHERDRRHERLGAGQCACNASTDEPLDEFDPTWDVESAPPSSVLDRYPADSNDSDNQFET